MADRAAPSGFLFARNAQDETTAPPAPKPMDYDPTTMVPPMDFCARRRIFLANIYRKPTQILFRDKAYTARVNEPSLQRKIGMAGYSDEVADVELMIALDPGTPKPVALSSDEIRIYDLDPDGRQTGHTDYRITDVRTDPGPDCYQLTLTKRRK